MNTTKKRGWYFEGSSYFKFRLKRRNSKTQFIFVLEYFDIFSNFITKNSGSIWTNMVNYWLKNQQSFSVLHKKQKSEIKIIRLNRF
jgi:hypothetical protein